MHSFEDTLSENNNGLVVKTWGITAMICIAVSTMMHSRAPRFMVDPKFEFRNDNVNEYLEFNVLTNVERIRSVNSNIK